MFLLLSLSSRPPQFNVKCDPAKAIELREKYRYIQPGFHMSKVHWNTVICEEGASLKILLNCIDESYSLVLSGLPAKTKKKPGI